MKRPPNYIILKQALRYLSESEKQELLKNLSTLNIKHKTYLNKIKKCFDVELFKIKPLIWQDIWLYNYIKYEADIKIKKCGLIAQYEREAFIEDDNDFFSKKETINSKNLRIK